MTTLRPYIKYLKLFQETETAMKLVTAIVKPFTLSDIKDALEQVGVHAMTGPRFRAAKGAQRGVPWGGIRH